MAVIYFATKDFDDDSGRRLKKTNVREVWQAFGTLVQDLRNNGSLDDSTFVATLKSTEVEYGSGSNRITIPLWTALRWYPDGRADRHESHSLDKLYKTHPSHRFEFHTDSETETHVVVASQGYETLELLGQYFMKRCR